MASTVKLLLAVVRGRSVLLAVATGVCLVVAVGYGLLAADQYRAVSTLFIEPNPFDERALSGSSGTARASELDLLRSERVAQRVVENERLIEEPAWRAQYLESIDAGRPPIEVLAQYVADRVQVTGSDDGGLVHLSVTLRDPVLAARVANAYAQAWGEVSLELRANAIRNGVERAHQDLASLRARLGEARARMNDGTALAAAGSRADEQFAQLSRLSTRPMAPSVGEVAGGAPNDVPVAIHNVATTVPLGAATGARFDTAEVGIPASAQGANQWDHVRDELRREARDNVQQNGAAVGAGAAISADDEIRLAQQSLERAEDRLTRLAAEGVGAPFPAHVLRPARVPDTSIKPSLAVCAALGLAGGLLLGVVAMLLGEIFDRRVRRPSDLSLATGIVVLGNLPAVKPPASSARGSRALRLQRAGTAIG